MPDATDENCEVGQMRGVKYAHIRVGSLGETGQVILTEQHWIKSLKLRYYLTGIFLIVILSICLAAYMANFCECFNREEEEEVDPDNNYIEMVSDDSNESTLIISRTKRCFMTIRKIINISIHILDIVGDILYILYVPVYNDFYKFLLIFWMFPPIICTIAMSIWIHKG